MSWKRTYLRTNLKLLAVLVILLGISSCRSRDSLEPVKAPDGQNSQGGLSYPELSTATPPADPDLRGTHFPFVLFILENAPYGNLMDSIEAGVEDGIRHLNASGGINGARIDLVKESFDLDSPNLNRDMLDATKKLDPLCVLMAVPVDESLLIELNRLDLPILYFGFGNNLQTEVTTSVENFFWLIPPSDAQFAFFLSELWQNWDQLRPSGAFNQLKVGTIFSNPDSSMILEAPGIQNHARKNNFDLLLSMSEGETSNPSTINFLVDAITFGVTTLYSDTYPPETGNLLNDLHSMAVTEFFVFGGSTWSIDGSVQESLVSLEPLEHYLVVLSVRWWNDPDSVGIQQARQIHTWYSRPTYMRDAGYLVALGSVDVVAFALGNAIHEEGSGNIGRSDLLQQLLLLEDYHVMTDLFTVNYSGKVKSPAHLRLWQVSAGGDWIPIGSGGKIPLLNLETE